MGRGVAVGKPLSSGLQVKVSMGFPGGIAQEAVRNMGPGSGVRAKDMVGDFRLERMVRTCDCPRRVCVGKKKKRDSN